MKQFLLLYIVVASLYLSAGADELSDAYRKEYTFLKAQKQELTSRLRREKAQQQRDEADAKFQVDRLSQQIVDLTKEIQQLQERIGKAQESLEQQEDNTEVIANVLMQASTTLGDYGIKVDDSNKTAPAKKIEEIFQSAVALYNTLSTNRIEKGSFFLKDGSKVSGDIVKVGNVAAYGLSAKGTGALAPAGEGAYKLWNEPGSEDDARALFEGKRTKSLDIFVYENLDKEVAYKKEKTVEDVIKSGGIIGYIILGLGMLGALLILLRIFFLMRSRTNVESITKIVVAKLNECKADEALDAIKRYKGSTARVIKTVLRNIKRDREHIEDIVTESILNESSALDRYGNFIMVIAAVAPLLGLLGTVSGMIATFDIITEYGTGDPKLLAGGISEALVTTMFGLIVAIPLLLIGNLLSGWAQKIKDDMEQGALHIVNLYEKNRARCKG